MGEKNKPEPIYDEEHAFNEAMNKMLEDFTDEEIQDLINDNKEKKMEYSNFLKLLMGFKKTSEEISELHDIGVDLFEGKFKIMDGISKIFNTSIEISYGKNGLDWVEWFIYESEYGQRDWSKVPTYKINEEGQSELVHGKGKVKFGAHDEEGNPICYSYESLWEYLEENCKNK